MLYEIGGVVLGVAHHSLVISLWIVLAWVVFSLFRGAGGGGRGLVHIVGCGGYK